MSQGKENDRAMELREAVGHFKSELSKAKYAFGIKVSDLEYGREELRDLVEKHSRLEAFELKRADDAVWRWFAWKLAAILLSFVVFGLSITLIYYK